MIETDIYRRQHNDLLKVSEQVLEYMDASMLRRNLSGLHSLLNNLSGKLNVHLAMEDESFFPRLLEHEDLRVRTLIKDYMSEMGTMSEKFKLYMNTWKLSQSIMDDPQEFIRQTEYLLGALKNRIERENAELYPLAEK